MERAERFGEPAALVEATWSVPPPGCGETPQRLNMLMELGRSDMSVARIAECHLDAQAILAEAGHPAQMGSFYGVWTAFPQNTLRAERIDSRWVLHGVKPACCGASLVNAALVTAQHQKDALLFHIPLPIEGVRVEPSRWATSALKDSAIASVSFSRVVLNEANRIGEANWYFNRPGFWVGKLSSAACWAGGALSLIDAALALNRPDPHSRAQMGALRAAGWSLRTWLDAAGREVDADPGNQRQQARRRALIVRHLVERTCVEVLDRFGRATGPQLLAMDAQVARQAAALALDIRRCSGERDLEIISAEGGAAD